MKTCQRRLRVCPAVEAAIHQLAASRLPSSNHVSHPFRLPAQNRLVHTAAAGRRPGAGRLLDRAIRLQVAAPLHGKAPSDRRRRVAVNVASILIMAVS